MNPTPPAQPDRHALVAQSRVMTQLLEQAQWVAASKAAVLIEGESGTGKELIARLIHTSSPRAQQPFVCVNCAALSETLIESELFGHERGAFTGAEDNRLGRFELADRGTLLLDEVSEISPKLQAKLLRVLEAEEFERVGGTRSLSVDVRALATTNRNLEDEVEAGNFRGDLFYRLNAVHLKVPALRERREDVAVLAQHFLARYRHECRVPLQGISRKALEILTAYDWPGNVRQLRNAIHRACILATKEEMQPQDLPPLQERRAPVLRLQPRTLAEMERDMILSTLRELGGNKTAAAQRLGVTTRTLLNKLNRYRACDAA